MVPNDELMVLLAQVTDRIFDEVTVVVAQQDAEQPHTGEASGSGPAGAVRQLASQRPRRRRPLACLAVAGVAILGMHRSGTSAVAGFLARAGYYAGSDEELLAPAEDNPKGFFERQDVNALNDEFFASLGGAWDRPPERGAIEAAAPAWQAKARELLGALQEQAGARPVVLKDPRISLALPLWRPVLEGSFTWLVVDRSPVDTALSVRKRDGRPLSVALALWELYSTELLAGLAGERALVVHYEGFVEAPGEKAAALLGRLAEALPDAAGRAYAELAEGFVSEGMRHHRNSLDSPLAAEVLTVRQMALARWLAGLPEGWVRLQPPPAFSSQPETALAAAAEYYDAMGDRYGMEQAYDTERHRALHFEQATELKDRHIANIELALEAMTKRAESAEGRAGQLERKLEVLEADNSELRAQLSRLRGDSLAAASNLLSVARARLTGGRLVGGGTRYQEVRGSARS